MSKADERLSAITSIGRLIKSQVNPPASGHKGPIYSQSTEDIKPLSTNIQIPLEARPPLELPTIMEDPNIVSALAGPIAPQKPGEGAQVYTQC